MKILILVPNLKNIGGVSALYNIIRIDQYDNVNYFQVQGKRELPFFLRAFEMIYLYFLFLLKLPQYNVVHINPSLNHKSFLRDGLYVYISNIFRKKVLVYWHGWESSFEQNIHSKKLLRAYFKHTFLKANRHIVLGSIFKQSLAQLGVDKENVEIESNAADNSFLKLNGPLIKGSFKNKKVFNLLFIARIEETKGIFITLDTLKILNKEGLFHLSVAGDGPALADAKRKTEVEHIKNVDFLGIVKGDKKHQAFAQSDILLFPTYSEGMPICIIEAMLYGLIVISRPVGGIPDWVKNGEHGYLIESIQAEDFANAIISLSRDEEKLKRISEKNTTLANEWFTPDVMNRRLFNYYRKLIES